MRMVLSNKAEDTRNLLKFHMECLAEVRKLFQYLPGVSLPDLHWHAYFMDDRRELHPKIGKLFEQYLGNMEVDINVLNGLPRLVDSNATDPFILIPMLVGIATWSLFGTIWKGSFMLMLLYHLSRLLLRILTNLLVGSLFKTVRHHSILRAILDRARHTGRFLDERLEPFTEAQQRLSGRNFCITESGWVLLYAKEGDGICVFRGCRFSFAVRRCGPRHARQYPFHGGYLVQLYR
jgi:hypothetical protein